MFALEVAEGFAGFWVEVCGEVESAMGLLRIARSLLRKLTAGTSTLRRVPRWWGSTAETSRDAWYPKP